jgi:hypothetical protein
MYYVIYSIEKRNYFLWFKFQIITKIIADNSNVVKLSCKYKKR